MQKVVLGFSYPLNILFSYFKVKFLMRSSHVGKLNMNENMSNAMNAVSILMVDVFKTGLL